MHNFYLHKVKSGSLKWYSSLMLYLKSSKRYRINDYLIFFRTTSEIDCGSIIVCTKQSKMTRYMFLKLRIELDDKHFN